MSPLSSCWLIIESILIPDGILKWFFLSFYIHPVFLVFCQIFLWVKKGQEWAVFIFFIIYTNIVHVWVYSFTNLKRCFLYIFSFSGYIRTGNLVAEDHQEQSHDNNNNTEEKEHDTVSSKEVCETSNFLLPRIYFIEFPTRLSFTPSLETVETVDHFEAEEMGKCRIEDSSYENSDVADECINLSDQSSKDSCCEVVDEGMVSSPSYVVSDEELDCMEDDSAREEIDHFFLEYTERMAWFDVLNQERLCGINTIENKNVSAGNLLIEQVEWSQMAKKRLIESMESDIELVYVAQTCLSWEALYHQYLKVEALSICSSKNGVFIDDIAGRFQQFQVLLERFVEDGRISIRKRHLDYALKRSSLKNFLQVPKISGFLSREEEGHKESTKVTEVLKAIERCIQAFWSYMIVDANQTSWWKSGKSSRFWKSQTPPVEDARDLDLLHELINELKKKEQSLKNVRASKKNKLKKNDTNPLHEEVQENDVSFTMIDMMLVKRVLRLSVISNCQLKWCHQKLASIDFHVWKITRRQDLDHLFPC